MILPITALPSRGKLTPEISQIEINPLVYKQIKSYSKRKSENEIANAITNIDYFIKDIPVWKKLSAFDLSTILFNRKYLSATTDDTVLISVNGKPYTLKVSDVTFKDINEALLRMRKVEFNGEKYDFHVPTIEEYYNALKLVQPLNIDWIDDKDCMILASLGLKQENYLFFIGLLERLEGDDIANLELIDLLLNDVTNDVTVKNEGGDVVISINGLISDIFQFIRINRKPNTDRIIFG